MVQFYDGSEMDPRLESETSFSYIVKHEKGLTETRGFVDQEMDQQRTGTQVLLMAEVTECRIGFVWICLPGYT